MVDTEELYQKIRYNQPMKGYEWVDFLRKSPRDTVLYAIPRNNSQNFYFLDKNYTIYIYSKNMSSPKIIEEIGFEEVDLYGYFEMSDIEPKFIEDTPLIQFFEF